MPTLSVNGTTLAYEDVGPRDGIALVFSHSLFFNRTMFRHQVERFSKDYRVITYDHRGQGESASSSADTLDMETLSEDAAALVEALGAGPCHILGNSLGGFIALRLAARRPDLVRSAVALGSSADEEHKVAEFAPLVEHLRQNGAGDVVDTLMYIMLGDTTLADPAQEALRDEWRAYMRGLAPSIGDAAHAVVYRKSVLEELGRTEIPVLAIAGAEDHAYPAPLSEQIARTAPRGRCVVVPRAGHSVALEQPDAVNEHLAAHFAAVDAASS
ncbi:alpha/beta fold hydrolase [Streptomyces sp. F63]|uniref:alpha/beta fold hydrolase n=1 Tax=Streptomyces sp. F63 TaxID=2824887 RepID=UPI001B36E731|nr:alpha/beta fold hydrolase [Streptomyces sp. F63]MBQ0985987.1 alpha/beta fold hydrolase [Streptomyces sp. F63]